jgi:hypothetical protein
MPTVSERLQVSLHIVVIVARFAHFSCKLPLASLILPVPKAELIEVVRR